MNACPDLSAWLCCLCAARAPRRVLPLKQGDHHSKTTAIQHLQLKVVVQGDQYRGP